PHRRLRRWSGASDAGPARRQAADGCGGIPARRRSAGRRTAILTMPRYKLTIEYNGAPFRGWQIQADGATVQGVLTDAIAALTGERPNVQGAGRTDAGVHARAQVAHVDLMKSWETDTIRDALNAHLR